MGASSRHAVPVADLAAHAERLDAARYVEHPALSGLLADFLRPDGDDRVLFLHGAGGIGKSALLRALQRAGTAQGYDVHALDGRDLGPAPLNLAEGPADAPLLITIDEADAIGPGLATVGRLAAGLPDTARLAIAGRRAPRVRWLPDVLEPLSQTVRVPRLPAEQSAEVLARYDVPADRRRTILDWAQGSPLALVVAASTPVGGGRSDDLVRQLAGQALESMDRELLEVASLTWAIDADLLAALVPEHDAKEALATLLRHTFVEQRGERAVLHPLLAREIAGRLAVEDPFRHHVLALRLASVLRERALAGVPSALPELGHLLRTPELRTMFGPFEESSWHIDGVHPGDAERTQALLGELDAREAEALTALLRTAFTVRDADGADDAAAVVAIGPATIADPDCPWSGPPAMYAARHGFAERTAITALGIAFGDLADDAERLRSMTAIQRCGVINPRYNLVNEVGWTPAARAAVATLGYVEVAELRRTIGGREVRTWLLDSGPGGFVGMFYRAVALGYGVTLPDGPTRGEALVAALDDFGSDEVLARLEIAPLGHTVHDAAEHARRLVRQTVRRALGGHPELLEIVEARYLAGPAGHDDVISALFLSRATYFRRLKEAKAILEELQ